MSLTARLWEGAAPTYAAIVEHPFLAGLTDGTLERSAFRHYLVQDALYLADYVRALAVTGARAPDADTVAMFARHADGAIVAERELHESIFRDLGLGADEVAGARQSPTCRAYTSYLLATAHAGSYAEAVAAVLPCYWIYREVGRELIGRGSPEPLYQRWIDTYGGAEFDAVVGEVLAACDRLEPSLTAAEEARMAERFATTSRYEWMFWDAGWRQEAWPVR